MARFQRFIILAASLVFLPRLAMAQLRISLGAGGGLAGLTESTLSDGRGAPVVMGQITKSVVPFLGIGVEVDDWIHGSSNVAFATAHVQLHVPATFLYVKLGAGYGTGDPAGLGSTSGAAIQIGAAYDLTVPLAPIAATVFANGFVSHAAAASIQMVDLGLALTWR
ncbi:MAG: hypothetical protein ACREPM_23690 [Gemmatimonadaceae bacterium]